MSVTIHWRPTNEKTKSFDNGTSTDLETIKRAFGNVIRDHDRPALRALAVHTDSPFWNEVIDVVAQVGDIEVWGEH